MRSTEEVGASMELQLEMREQILPQQDEGMHKAVLLGVEHLGEAQTPAPMPHCTVWPHELP